MTHKVLGGVHQKTMAKNSEFRGCAHLVGSGYVFDLLPEIYTLPPLFGRAVTNVTVTVGFIEKEYADGQLVQIHLVSLLQH